MKNRLFATIPLFVLVFLPLHILPPVLSNLAYRTALGQSGAVLVSLAHHFGFAVAGVLLLLMSPKWRGAIVGSKRLLALLVLLPTLINLLAPLPCQLLGRFVGGMVSAALFSVFYRELKAGNDYQSLPAIFALSGLILESFALTTGWLVNSMGSAAGMQFHLAIAVVLTLLISVAPARTAITAPAASAPGNFSFSGSRAFMAIAVMAYGGFFLMLLLLGSLQSLQHGSLLSGIAIFSTALAFSVGNMLPLENFSFFRVAANPVRMGCAISVLGSSLVWFGHANGTTACLLSGVFLVALGNGITVARCFQNAVLSSADGFSAPLLTMVGIMALPITLTLGASLLRASAPMVQLLAFSMALMIALGIGKQRSVTA